MLVVPLFGLIIVLYALPVINILWLGVSEPELGIQNYKLLFTKSSLVKILWTTIRVCLITTLCSVVIGYLIAYSMVHLVGREQNWMLTLVLISFWISVLVRAFSWLTLLGRNGLLNAALVSSGLSEEPINMIRNEFGVLIGMIHYMVPYAVLPLLANMQGIDHRIMDASRSLGAGSLQTFLKIYLPLTKPGVIASSLLVFIISLGFYVTPALLGGGRVLMVAEYVSVQILITVQWGLAAMLATLLLSGVFALLYIMSRFMKIGEIFGARP
ncbi:MAG: ABC transporter permease [Verrucomicrobiota bacterium]|nr:ABC transporter permease [Verrucomicrobiota bacterium]